MCVGGGGGGRRGERILDCQTPCMGVKATQFATSLGTVPLEGLVSANTEQPLHLMDILHACHPVGVSWCVGVWVYEGQGVYMYMWTLHLPFQVQDFI